LLKIEPGIYDIGATSLQLRPWVDVEGSGIGVTTIRGSVDAIGLTNGTINGANDTEIRSLTVEATGTATVGNVIAIYNLNANPRLYRVKLVAQATSAAWGMRNLTSAPLLDECEITASTTSTSGFPSAYGIVFRNYVASGQRSSILRSKILATGAGTNYGLYLEDGQTVTEIRDTRIDAVGGRVTYGIYAKTFGGWSGQENLALRNLELSSVGGSSASYGIFFEASSSIMLDVFASRIYGHVSPTTYGIVQRGSAAIGLQGSTVAGFTKTIDTVSNISIASTFLNGGPTTALGWLGCMGVWDENGVFYANSCPP